MPSPISPVEAIRKEMESGGTTDVGIFTIKSANKTISDAAMRPNPRNLFCSLWYEGEVSCLFSDSNLGKSIYAVQIAEEIARYDRILLIDCELSDKQFQLRYTDEISGAKHIFPENMFRAEINPASFNVKDYEERILGDIESAALKLKAKIIIVDNLTYLCNASDKGVDAGLFMMKLIQLKMKYGWSLLVIAHTPKRSLSSSITQNDLAGSKKLYNFFDSVFAIGKSAKDSRLRYVKQLKVRAGEFRYSDDNVMVYEIEKSNAFVHFEFKSYDSEREHLKEQKDDQLSERDKNILDLLSQGKSCRDIAQITGYSKSLVSKVSKANKASTDVHASTGVDSVDTVDSQRHEI